MRISKKQAREYTNEELLEAFENCNTTLVHEVNSSRGQSNATTTSLEILKEELLKRLNAIKEI